LHGSANLTGNTPAKASDMPNGGIRGEARLTIKRRDETPDEQQTRELTQARNEIRALRHRVDALERTVQTAATLLNPIPPIG
jgi:outer membrane protein TolC